MTHASLSGRFRFCALCCLVFMMALLGACDSGPAAGRNIDSQWHQRDLDTLLSRWLAVSPTTSGLFNTAIDRHWHPLPSQRVELTMQSRLIYSMVAGYEVTGDRRYLDAATHGADFLLEHFHDSTYGGFFDSVDMAGNAVNSGKKAYSHAFALFALSHVARVTRDARYRAAALNAWHDIKLNLMDADGGIVTETSRDFHPSGDSRTQNPVMHLFEALLVLIDATGDPEALAGAQNVGHFVLYRLLKGEADGGAYITEWYDQHWQPLPSREKGAYTEIGHQFEWVHLMADAERRGLPSIYGMAGERVLKFALKAGYDEDNGGVFSRVYPDEKGDRDKYYWQQAEALRALMVVAANGKRPDLWRRYQQTLDLVKTQFVDGENGGWWTAIQPSCKSGHCDEGQPEPYHMIGLHMAALDLSRRTSIRPGPSVQGSGG